MLFVVELFFRTLEFVCNLAAVLMFELIIILTKLVFSYIVGKYRNSRAIEESILKITSCKLP